MSEKKRMKNVSIIHITVMMLSGKPPFNIVRLGNVTIWMPRACLICRAGESILTFNNSVVIYTMLSREWALNRF
jgi:hypothetical protein